MLSNITNFLGAQKTSEEEEEGPDDEEVEESFNDEEGKSRSERINSDEERDNSKAEEEPIESSTKHKSGPTRQQLIFKLEGLGTFPVQSLDYEINFLKKPAIKCRNKPEFSFLFPGAIEDFKSTTALLDIKAFKGKELQAKSSIDVTKLTSDMHKKVSSRAKFPVSVESEQSSEFHNEDGQSTGAMKMKLIFICMGPTMEMDAVVRKEEKKRKESVPSSEQSQAEPSISSQAPKTSKEPKYDEFCAVINGHNLRVRLPKDHNIEPSVDEGSDCDQTKKSGSKKGKSKKFKVKNCKEQNHQHLDATVNVFHEGDTDTGEDSFTIVIGKRSDSESGSLEINLKAPKELQAANFKPPSRSSASQTEKDVAAPAEPQPHKKGKKGTKKPS